MVPVSGTNLSSKKPWDFSPEPHQKPLLDAEKDCALLPASKVDFERVVQLYQQYPVRGFNIKTVKIVHNPNLSKAFEARIYRLEKRHKEDVFLPKWEKKPETEEESQQIKHRKSIISLLDKVTADYRVPEYPHVKFLPTWHGTKPTLLESICYNGFAILSSNDPGYFGSGIYTTIEAKYAHIYSKGALLINWVAFLSAFPVINNDMEKLIGKGHYQNYDAHFAPVVPVNSDNPQERCFFACECRQEAVYKEIVVFDESQIIPCYSVELQVGLTKIPKQNQEDTDQEIALAYVKYADTLTPGENIWLSDGRSMDHHALYLEAIKIDPKCSEAYLKLASALSKSETIRLPDDRTMSQQALFLEVIKLDPTNSQAYNNLGAAQDAQETIELPDGRTMDEKALYLEAIKRNARLFQAFNNLAETLAPDEHILLGDGRRMNDRALNIAAIKLNPKNSQSYSSLADKLGVVETVHLDDHHKMNKRKLYLEAIKLDQKNSQAYNGLGTMLKVGELEKLPDGRKMHKQDLFREAIRLDPKNAQAYINLGSTLGLESIQLLNGSWMSKKTLIQEAIKLYVEALLISPKDSEIYFLLGGLLKKVNEFNFQIGAE